MLTINPATEEPLGDYPEISDSELQDRLEQAAATFAAWSRSPLHERRLRMRRLAELLREQQDQHARLITQEMGKPLAQATAEVAKCALACDYFADHAAGFLEPEVVGSQAAASYVRFDPLGPILAVMPWNFPYWQVFRFAAPALMAGNVGLLKHASNVSGSAVAIERLFAEAGFPGGAMTSLLVSAARVSDIIAHPSIAAVTLTGSEPAGRAVAATAGQHLKKTVLELGGSDPFIVLADAHLPEAARQAVQARLVNSGQSCIAAKRFIVEESVAAEFESLFVEHFRNLRVGDPLDPATQVGPLARADLLDDLDDQVRRSVQAGAECVLGGHRMDGRGYFYAPTVLRGVRPGMAAFDEETFGPVAALVRARNAEEAITLANRSRFGLGASLWTSNLERGQRWAERIEAGCVFLNAPVVSDPRLPFGGIKASGYGRELSRFGLREFVNIKSVWCESGSS